MKTKRPIRIMLLVWFCLSKTLHSQNLICNGNFDSIPISTPYALVTNAQVPCWYTTSPDSLLEIWTSGFNGVPAFSGNQFLEMNGWYPCTIYQGFYANPGSSLNISFAHRGRLGVDSVRVLIGPASGPYSALGKFGDGSSAWGLHSINYVLPNAGFNYVIKFVSFYWGYGVPTFGNFLDDINITLNQAQPSVILASSDTNLCEKHCIDFYDLSTNNPTSWQWFFPGADCTTSTLQYPIDICYNTYGSFDVTLIACNAAGCDTLMLPGFINEYMSKVPNITRLNDTLFSSPGTAYQWWSVDSGIIAGATNNYFVPTQGGTYYVIVTDSVGCSGASNVISITGVNQLSPGSYRDVNYQLSIIPDPNDGSFTISINDFIRRDFSLRIIDRTGREINKRQEAIGNWQRAININLENIAPGLYSVEMINDNKIYRGRFIIQ